MAIRNQQENKVSNETRNIKSQCKVVVYRWFRRNLDPEAVIIEDQALAQATRLEVSSQIRSCSFSKNMSQPTGTFQFTLTNSPGVGSGDWKDIIKRGDWCIIYMTQDGDLTLSPDVGPPVSGSQKTEKPKIRCIGFIDRVAVKSSIDERGAFDVEYEVSGRDFGVVYEDTSIWHNIFKFEQIILQSIANNELNITRKNSLTTVIDTIHDLFFNPSNLPGAKINDNKSLTTIALQWLLPQQMITDIFGANVSTRNTFWGELSIKNFYSTEAAMAVERPTDYLSGNAWDQLKRLSVPQFHELFTETTDEGKPQLTFRPIPFGIDDSQYPILSGTATSNPDGVGNASGKSGFILYKDIPDIVSVPAIDVVDFNLGEENHSRYNSFLATVSTSLINTEDNISVLQDSDFPYFNQLSIKRFGFRPMHVTVNSIVKNAQKNNGKSDRRLLTEFNYLIKDYWENSVFSESGSLSKIGSNDIKIGKALTFQEDVPYVNARRYYIEGYTDSFEVLERGETIWLQDVMLTRGFEESDLQNPTNTNFEERESDFTKEGEFTSSGSVSNKKGSLK